MVIDRFYFSNGESAGNLDEFLEKLKVIDDECFLHHVNGDDNDFANWIKGSLGNKVLGRQVGKLKDRSEIIGIINKKINTPAKVRKSIIRQIREAILHE